MLRMPPALFRALTLSLLALLLGACASHKPKLMSEKDYYEQAQKSMHAGNFTKASEDLEALESHYPVLFEDASLREDSAGAGRFRGGFGIQYTVKLRRGEASAASARSTKTWYPAESSSGTMMARSSASAARASAVGTSGCSTST